MDLNTLLFGEFCRADVALNKWLICHRYVGIGIFASTQSVHGIPAGYSNSSLEFADRCCQQSPTFTYGRPLMEDARKGFHILANLFYNEVVDRNGVEHDVRIVQAPFCATRSMKDSS